MARRRFNVLVQWDENDDAWVTYVPSLGNLSTYGDTREEALENTREAILGYLEAASKEGIAIPPGDSDAELVDVDVMTA